jgi:uncharacterized membrane protein (UPF0127 family)
VIGGDDDTQPHPGDAWLLRGSTVLASVEVADSGRTRRRGLLGREGHEGALLLTRTRWVHTVGMRFPIDVAFLDRDGVVIKLVTMHRWHVGVPMTRAASVLEAEAGAFGRWGLQLGDQLTVRGS